MSSDFGSRFQRRPLIRVRRASHGGWKAEGEDTIREGLGETPVAALGDWFHKNAERLGFDVRVD